MKPTNRKKPLHRSFSLDAELVEEARRLAPRELSDNLNRMINVALAQLVGNLRRRRLEVEMERMASDSAIVRASARITREFKASEADGL